jgi:hypothetical protein
LELLFVDDLPEGTYNEMKFTSIETSNEKLCFLVVGVNVTIKLPPSPTTLGSPNNC